MQQCEYIFCILTSYIIWLVYMLGSHLLFFNRHLTHSLEVEFDQI